MNGPDETGRTAERLRDALGAAADLMRKNPATFTEPARPRRSRVWLVPLTAAAAVVAVVLTSVVVTGNLGGPRTQAGGAPTAGTGTPPDFYLTVTSTTVDHAVLEVHSTVTGTVTASAPTPGVIIDNTNLTADASDRAFYVASFPACTTAVPVTRFYRITIDAAGRITGERAVGAPVRGMVDSIAVSPDGTRMAYFMDGFPTCENPRSTEPQQALSVMDLSTGAVRTWHNAVTDATPATPRRVSQLVSGLSWADGRTVIANYRWGDLSQPAPASLNEQGVLALNTAAGGGLLQADSRVLLWQGPSCVTCLTEAVAGPGSTLTVAASQAAGKNLKHVLVVRVDLSSEPSSGLHFSRVLLSQTGPAAPLPVQPVYADSSGQYVVTWPPMELGNGSQHLKAGWVRSGRLVPLPGTTMAAVGNFFAW